LRGLISYAFELSVEGVFYKHPFTGRLTKVVRDFRFLGGTEFLTENAGKNIAWKGLGHGTKDVLCKTEAFRRAGKGPGDNNVIVTFVIWGMESLFSFWRVCSESPGEGIQFGKMTSGLLKKVPGPFGYAVRGIEFGLSKISVPKFIEYLNRRSGADALRITGGADNFTNPVATLRLLLRNLMIPEQANPIHATLLKAFEQLPKSGDTVAEQVARFGARKVSFLGTWAPGTDTQGLSEVGLILSHMAQSKSTFL